MTLPLFDESGMRNSLRFPFLAAFGPVWWRCRLGSRAGLDDFELDVLRGFDNGSRLPLYNVMEHSMPSLMKLPDIASDIR